MNHDELTDDEILAELAERTPRRPAPKEPDIRAPVPGMHSEAHALAKDASDYCGEPKRFGQYLGVIKRIGAPRAYQILSEMRQSRKEIRNRGALFMAKARTKTT